MPKLGFHVNQEGRRKLAAKLMVLNEEDKPNARFEDALLAINSHFEGIDTDDIEQYWDRWAELSDRVRTETDERERKRFEYMFALVGTALEEMRSLGFR